MGCGSSSQAAAAPSGSGNSNEPPGQASGTTPPQKTVSAKIANKTVATVYGESDPEFRNLPKALTDPTTHPTSHLRLNVVFMNRTEQTKPMKLIGMDHPMHHGPGFAQVYNVEKKILGSGATGDVKVCTKKSTGQKYALKYINMNRLKKAEIAAFLQEVELLAVLDHPNIIKLYETFQDKSKLYMIFELCPGGDLFDRVASKQFLKEKEVTRIVKKMCSALTYLHDRHIVHRDIKLENWIFEGADEDAEIKLIDFGLSVVYADNEKYHKVCGSVHYVAPEVLKGSYSKACDIWSMGVSVYTMLAGARPFNGRTDEDVVDMVMAGHLSFHEPQWTHISSECKQWIKACVCIDPHRRLTAKQAGMHVWLHKDDLPDPPEIDKSTLSAMMTYEKVGKLKKFAMQSVAYHMNPEEQRKLRAEFCKVDTEGNGYITYKELLQAIRRTDPAMAEDKIKDMFDGMDIEGKGHVDYTEFLAATLQKRIYMEQEALYNAFHLLDTTDCGTIQSSDLATIFGNSLKPSEIEGIMKEAKTSSPGVITFDEFKELMNSEAYTKNGRTSVVQIPDH